MLDLEPLHQSECSKESRLLACGSYLPLCDPIHPKITAPPCRSLCFAVQSSCLQLFHAVDLPSPAIMNCSALPDPPYLCVSSRQATTSAPTQSPATPSPSPSNNNAFTLVHIGLFVGLPSGLVVFSFSVVVVVICVRASKLPQPGPSTVTFSASPRASRPLPAPPLEPRAIPAYATSHSFSAPLYANMPEPNYANVPPTSSA